MSRDDVSPRTLRSPIARGAVLLSSGSLAALLVIRSGAPGCGGPSAPAETKAAPAAPAAPAATEPQAPQQQPAPAPVNEPGPPAANAAPEPLPIAPEPVRDNAGPRYFPASKSGVFIEPQPPPQVPPQQQAGPR